jgi:hypothetical protein
MAPGTSPPAPPRLRQTSPLATYPLLDALLHRRSRRFAPGMHLSAPLEYRSEVAPQPLTLEEEAALAFAACGVTGYALAELPYASAAPAEPAGGNIMVNFIGRTVASGHALHYATVFVINDEGAWMLRRPQDYPRAEIPGLIQAAREGRLVELYQKARVRVAERRVDVPRQVPIVPPFNRWAANRPGTTYFLPVNEFTEDYINVLLAAFSEDFGYFLVDDRCRFRPAGIEAFVRSKGGHLHDDPHWTQRSQAGEFSSEHQYSWRVSSRRFVPPRDRPASVTPDEPCSTRTTASLARGMVALSTAEVPSCPGPRRDAVGSAAPSARPCSSSTPDWGRASGRARPRPASERGMPRTAGPGAGRTEPSPARTTRTTSSRRGPPRGRPRCRRTISRLSSAVSAPRCETR